MQFYSIYSLILTKTHIANEGLQLGPGTCLPKTILFGIFERPIDIVELPIPGLIILGL